MKLITVLATCIHVCIELNNNVLKRLLFDYAKKKIQKNQIIVLYIKIASMDTNTPLYRIMDRWIRHHNGSIIHQLIHHDL
jgi:hypothetical protein